MCCVCACCCPQLFIILVALQLLLLCMRMLYFCMAAERVGALVRMVLIVIKVGVGQTSSECGVLICQPGRVQALAKPSAAPGMPANLQGHTPHARCVFV